MYCEAGPHNGPVARFIKTCKQYNLLPIVKNAVEQCIFPTKSEYKKKVQEKVWAKENEQWRLRATMYSTLQTVCNVMPQINMISWWLYAQNNPSDTRKCRTVVKLLLKCHQLKACRYLYKEKGTADPFCEACDDRLVEDAKHVLFECKGNSRKRLPLWQSILNCCPDQLSRELRQMPIDDRVVFLLSGLGNSFIPEWSNLYNAIAKFVHILYYSRCADEVL